jgi:hypothetical protein
MKEELKKLSDAQIAFICRECRLNREQLFSLDEDGVYERVYDVMCDIEIAEIPAKDEEKESRHCRMASRIVTILGNALAKSEGLFDEAEECPDGETERDRGTES